MGLVDITFSKLISFFFCEFKLFLVIAPAAYKFRAYIRLILALLFARHDFMSYNLLYENNGICYNRDELGRFACPEKSSLIC